MRSPHHRRATIVRTDIGEQAQTNEALMSGVQVIAMPTSRPREARQQNVPEAIADLDPLAAAGSVLQKMASRTDPSAMAGNLVERLTHLRGEDGIERRS